MPQDAKSPPAARSSVSTPRLPPSATQERGYTESRESKYETNGPSHIESNTQIPSDRRAQSHASPVHRYRAATRDTTFSNEYPVQHRSRAENPLHAYTSKTPHPRVWASDEYQASIQRPISIQPLPTPAPPQSGRPGHTSPAIQNRDSRVLPTAHPSTEQLAQSAPVDPAVTARPCRRAVPPPPTSVGEFP